jgi:anti-sigma B factor antagonist
MECGMQDSNTVSVMTATASGLPQFSLTVTRAGRRTVVAVAGELDLAKAEEFTAGVRERLAEGPLILDMRELSFMDSAGVRALDSLLREAGTEGHSLLIVDELRANVRKALELTGMLAALPLIGEIPAE